MSPSDDLALALRLADTADAVTLPRFRAADLQVHEKPDHTPVSDADTAAEAAIRTVLAVERPDDAILGEEEGLTGTGARRWVLDPIDGTKNFVRGVPVWASLIALMDGNAVVTGVVSAPALGRRWWAASGEGSFSRDPAGVVRRNRVSGVGSLGDASFGYSSLTGWEAQGRLDGLLALSRRVWRTRGYGDFWTHVMVAEGLLDASAEPVVSLWDLAALVPVVTEAGGRFTGLDGVAGPDRGSAVASNGLLHDAVLTALAATV